MNKVVRGRDGRDGRDGEMGSPGRNAYEMACEAGYSGSLQLFLEQIIGRAALCDGEGIYQSAVANGYRGDFEDLIKLLQGPVGPQGPKGEPGKSAFEIAVEQGFRGNVHEWLKSLRGKDGKDGRDGDRGPRGEKGEKGDKGEPGKTVYLGGGGGGGGTPTPGGGAVDSVNGQTGVVVLSASDVGAASSAQGAKADTAVQPGSLATVATSGAYADLSGQPSLATVATSGAYADLSGKPTLGTAAATASTDYATAAQGAKADTALQSSAIIDSIGDADTTHAPSRNAVFDALALKAPLASPTFTGTVSGITAAMVGAPSGSGTSSGTNTGDQTSIVGITGTKAQFDTALTDDNFGYVGAANTWTLAQTFGAQIIVADSTSYAAAAIKFSGANAGFVFQAGADNAKLLWRLQGGNYGALSTVGVMLASVSSYTFTSASGVVAGSTADTGIGRNAAGVTESNNGTQGTLRDHKLRNLLCGGGNGSYVQTPSMTVANLAAAATAGAGARAFVTDANTTLILGLGLTVVGGGANKVPVYSDGATWLIG